MTNEKYKVIIDTDIGDDIDDALAILYALKSDSVDLLGVTTVFRNAKMRAMLARRLLDVFGRTDVPVFAGISDPVSQNLEEILGAVIMNGERKDEDGLFYPPQFCEDYVTPFNYGAVNFITETAKKYKGQLVLVPIGPLTNIAAAIKAEPTLVDCVKEIRLMGGSTDESFAEWNIACDPEAAQIVFSSGIPVFEVGYNVTSICAMDEADMRAYLEKEGAEWKMLADMTRRWHDYYKIPTPVLHDPLTVATLVSDYVMFEERKVRVGLKGNERGRIIVDASADVPGRVGVSVNVDKTRFLRDFINTLLK